MLQIWYQIMQSTLLSYRVTDPLTCWCLLLPSEDSCRAWEPLSSHLPSALYKAGLACSCITAIFPVPLKSTSDAVACTYLTLKSHSVEGGTRSGADGSVLCVIVCLGRQWALSEDDGVSSYSSTQASYMQHSRNLIKIH